jgi:RNA polymerase sigma-70 factor (ECF subfamily)
MITEADEKDRQLLKGIVAGDQSAMRDFYNAHESRIYAYATNKLNDTHAAADIVNEVMIAVWKGADKYQGKSKVRSWLLRIAHYKVVDVYRKNGRAEMTELDEALPDEENVSTLEIVGALENRKYINECLERLSDSHREVIHLSFFEDMAYADVATIMGCPEGTVKTRMFHARQLLKRCLQKFLSVDDAVRL